MTDGSQWRRCSACKKPIDLGALYWVCSVSTCNRKRTGLVFCTVECWEVHLPTANHREAWAVERTAPETATPPEETRARPAAQRRATPGASAPRASAPRAAKPSEPAPPKEVLIVASRLKEYIRLRSGMNTSDRVLEPLSEIVRRVCEEAIRSAGRDGRRTVLDRDIPGA